MLACVDGHRPVCDAPRGGTFGSRRHPTGVLRLRRIAVPVSALHERGAPGCARSCARVERWRAVGCAVRRRGAGDWRAGCPGRGFLRAEELRTCEGAERTDAAASALEASPATFSLCTYGPSTVAAVEYSSMLVYSSTKSGAMHAKVVGGRSVAHSRGFRSRPPRCWPIACSRPRRRR